MIDVYIILGCITAIYDCYVLYNNDVPIEKAMLIGIVDGVIWPIRWAHDIFVWLLKRVKL